MSNFEDRKGASIFFKVLCFLFPIIYIAISQLPIDYNKEFEEDCKGSAGLGFIVWLAIGLIFGLIEC